MSSVTVSELVDRLAGVRTIAGGWSARCPAHDDHRQSLSVSAGDDGRVLLKCHAGCEFGAIVEALGLETKDLFPPAATMPGLPPRKEQRKTPPPLGADQVAAWQQALRDDPEAWRHVIEVLRFTPGAVEAAGLGLFVTRGRRWLMYPYRHAGRWTYAKGRSLGGEKDFHREPSGQPSHLYGMDDLERGGTAIVVEGERDVVAAHSMGLGAEFGGAGGASVVSLPDGAKKKFSDEIIGPLKSQSNVILLTDADGPGDDAAAAIAEAVGRDKCRRVRLASHKDLGDVLTDLGADKGLEAVRIAAQAATEASIDPAGTRKKLRLSVCRFTADQLRTAPPPLAYILEPYIPERKVITLAGPGGSNKTTLLTYLAVCRALGRSFYGRTVPSMGKTAILTTEDGSEDYWRRLAAIRHEVGDEFDEQAVADNLVVFDMAGEQVRLIESDHGMFSVSPFVDHFAAVLKQEAQGADLVVVETVSRLCGGIENNESMSVLVNAAERVCKLAGVSMVLVAHMSKEAAREGYSDASAPRGGSALGDNGRSTIILQRINENNRKELLPDAELTREQMRSLLILRHPKSIGPTAEDLLLERTSTPYGPVLRPASVKTKEQNRDTLRVKLWAVIADLTRNGIAVSGKLVETTYSAEIGCSQKEVRKLIHEALKKGELAERRLPERRGMMLVPVKEPLPAEGSAAPKNDDRRTAALTLVEGPGDPDAA